MEVLTSHQLRELDAYTIAHEPIASVDLMERAALACFEWISKHIQPGHAFYIFCGPGNNGGDGLALARMLYEGGYAVRAFWFGNDQATHDNLINLERLISLVPELAEEITDLSSMPATLKHGTIVDALFGTGLSRPLTGLFSEIVHYINRTGLPVISIDMPSGLRSDESSIGTEVSIVKAKTTLTFQYLKQALLVGENESYYGDVVILDIGLIPDGLQTGKVRSQVTDESSVKTLYRKRPEFSHKGTFGHVLLMVGSTGKTGAALLAASGCLRSGAGLLTLLVPQESLAIVQSAMPEAMAMTYETALKNDKWENWTALGAGPGIGTSKDAQSILRLIMQHASSPMVLDADALNLVSTDPSLIELIPPHSILTPHPGEFRRMVGNWKNDFEKLDKQKAFAAKYNLVILLKGRYSTIATPDEQLWFNSTGNSGLAKGGTGDVLTGLIAGLLASGYPPRDAAIVGAWLHGKAGELASQQFSKEGMKAGNVAEALGTAWTLLRS